LQAPALPAQAPKSNNEINRLLMRTFVSMVMVVLVATVLGGAWWFFMGAKAQMAGGPGAGGPPGGFAMPVEAAPVKVAASRREVAAIGTLRSNESISVRPEVNGRIVEIGFAEGQKVRKGQILVRLDASVERAELAQAQASLALAKANFDRAEELTRRGAGTQRALDEARWKLRNDEAAVNLVQARLEKYTLVSPFDGVTGLRKISQGEYVSAGTEIVHLEMIDPLKVDFRVPEMFLGSVRNGQTIQVGVDAFVDRAFNGEIYAIDPLIDTAGRSIVIRARVTNIDDYLRPGLFGRVTLTLAVRENAIFVPEESLIPIGDQQFVIKLLDPPQGAPFPPGAKMAKQVPVKLGERRKGEAEVIEGLVAGDTVITAGVLKVRDGMPVQAIPQPPIAAASSAPATGR
jgi:membrane fusion protein, multidrug efflux system